MKTLEILGGVLLWMLIGGWMIYMIRLDRRKRASRARWPSVQGIVDESYTWEGDSRVSFSYEVGGVQYSRDQAWDGWEGTDYQKGDKYPIYYNPAKPVESIIRPEASTLRYGNVYVALVFWVIFGLTGLIAVLSNA